MAALDMDAIAKVAGSEFAHNLQNEVRGTHEVEFTTEDDFVAESKDWTDPEELINFVDEEEPTGQILATHW